MLLYEPFASLDERTAESQRRLLIRVWAARPTTVLMVTHNLREALLLADRVIVLAPRPAQVLGVFDLGLSRDQRDKRALDRLVLDFHRRFPDSA